MTYAVAYPHARAALQAAIPSHPAGSAAGGAAGGSGARGAGYLRAEEPVDNIVRTRTYDLYITYDQYYQVRHAYDSAVRKCYTVFGGGAGISLTRVLGQLCAWLVSRATYGASFCHDRC